MQTGQDVPLVLCDCLAHQGQAMNDKLKITILGCGSSGGVPRIGGDWGLCDPSNPKNRRQRCAVLVERLGATGKTQVLIDAGPDVRNQLLTTGVSCLDAVLFTHEHADHCHGIDDLRVVAFNRRARLPVWADRRTLDVLTARFGYAFIQPPDSPYPPILEMNRIDHTTPFTIDGEGGSLRFTPIPVQHGAITALGFRVGDVGYIPDVSHIPDTSIPLVTGLELWILDALRRTGHFTHFDYDTSLKWIDRMAPRSALLTNMHVDLDYATVLAETPNHIAPAYDGLAVEFVIHE